MSKRKPEVMRHEADGAEVAVQIPYLAPGDKLYVTNTSKKVALEILPKFYAPLQPGETRLFEGRAERQNGDPT